MNDFKRIIPKSAAFLLMAMLAFYGCNQEDPDPGSTLVVEETTFAENVFTQLAGDVEDLVSESALTSGRKGLLFGWGMMRWGFSDCAVVTRERGEGEEYPVTITIDYGERCESKMHGIVKSGKIIIEVTGDMKEDGSQRIVTFEDYKVNGNEIKGLYTITNLAGDSYSMVLENGEIITEDGTIKRNSEKIRTRIEGGDTDTKRDDVWQITGSARGTTIDNVTFTRVILDEDPLIAPRDCFWIVSGTVITTIGDLVVTIDFGDGDCDNLATRTVEGEDPEEFEMNCRMKKWHRWKRMGK